jgi:hypothetical protein
MSQVFFHCLTPLAYKTHFTVSYYYNVSYIPASYLLVKLGVRLQSEVQPMAGFSLLACSQKCCRPTQSYNPLLWYIFPFFYLPLKAARFEPLIVGIWVECSTTVLSLLAYKTHFAVSYYCNVSYIPTSNLMVKLWVCLQTKFKLLQTKASFSLLTKTL